MYLIIFTDTNALFHYNTYPPQSFNPNYRCLYNILADTIKSVVSASTNRRNNQPNFLLSNNTYPVTPQTVHFLKKNKHTPMVCDFQHIHQRVVKTSVKTINDYLLRCHPCQLAVFIFGIHKKKNPDNAVMNGIPYVFFSFK